jgi:hypothetical protein
MLDEMKNYLQAKPACAQEGQNNCYVWEKMNFNHQDNHLTIDAILNNSELGEIILPFNSNQLTLTDFSYDLMDSNNTQAHMGVMRQDNTYILGAEPGRYHVKMNFTLLDTTRMSLNKVWLATGNININNLSHEAQVSVESTNQTKNNNDNQTKQYNLNADVSIDKTITLNGTRWISNTIINSTQDTNITLPLFEGEHAIHENQLDSEQKNISLSLKAGESVTVESFFLPISEIKVPTLNYPLHLSLHGSELYQAKPIDNTLGYFLQQGQDNQYWFYSKQAPIDLKVLIQKAIVKDTSIISQYNVHSELTQGKLNFMHQIDVHSGLATQLIFTTKEGESIKNVSLNNKTMNYATLSNHTYSVSVDAGDSSIVINTEKTNHGFYISSPFFKLNMPIFNETWSQSTDGIWAVLATGSYHTSIAWVGVLLCMFILSFFVAKNIFPMGVIASFILLFGAMQGGLALIALMLITFSLIQYRKTHIIRDYFMFNVVQILIAILIILTFYLVIDSIHMSLILNHPNLYMSNLDDSENILWFSAYYSHIGGLLYLPLSVYKIIMLLWTFWFAYLIIDRAKWIWASYTYGSFYWKKSPKALAKEEKKSVATNLDTDKTT